MALLRQNRIVAVSAKNQKGAIPVSAKVGFYPKNAQHTPGDVSCNYCTLGRYRVLCPSLLLFYYILQVPKQ